MNTNTNDIDQKDSKSVEQNGATDEADIASKWNEIYQKESKNAVFKTWCRPAASHANSTTPISQAYERSASALIESLNVNEKISVQTPNDTLEITKTSLTSGIEKSLRNGTTGTISVITRSFVMEGGKKKKKKRERAIYYTPLTNFFLALTICTNENEI
ncbi:hypothetical protein RFI_15727 [Reticulomyxa filosa]|uniref:Uncharacterized protein n=1 Tax=Reticulomyxa filosa TaxID=46433 RepID=X6N6D5_RETFI|nr:hypothetical protein RFI_15727 [Reticulomyxa filosa]|eukprot:ETO21478.1 hypothetical protein RFI_15727 [Reticulomyxa filosa]